MTKASDILREVSLFESFFTGFDDFKNPVVYGVDKKLMEDEDRSDEVNKLIRRGSPQSRLEKILDENGTKLYIYRKPKYENNKYTDYHVGYFSRIGFLSEPHAFEDSKSAEDFAKKFTKFKSFSEAKEKKELSVYVEIDDGGKITRMEPEAFRKAVGGAHSGFAQDWVDKYNKDKGSKMARLVYAKNGKEIGRKVESIKERSSDAIKMKPDDEKKIALLKASLLNTPLVKKKEVTAQIDSIKAKYESRNLGEIEIFVDYYDEGKNEDKLDSLKLETKDFIKGSIFAEGNKVMPGSMAAYGQIFVWLRDSPKIVDVKKQIDILDKDIKNLENSFPNVNGKKYVSYDNKARIKELHQSIKELRRYASGGEEGYDETKNIIKGSIFTEGDSYLKGDLLAFFKGPVGRDRRARFNAAYAKQQQSGDPFPSGKEWTRQVIAALDATLTGVDGYDSDRARSINQSTANAIVFKLEESLMEGGPGSGGQYPTQKMKMPLSPFISVGTRKGILKNMPFEIETVPLSKITHVAQRKFVPFKVKNLCKSPDGISKKPICLLKVPSEDAYHVMDGHHRFLAAIKKGMDSLDAKVWIKFEEPKVDEPIAEEPPVANEIDLDSIPSGEPDLAPAEAEAIDVTIDGEPSSIEGSPVDAVPAMDTPNVTLDDAPLTATDPFEDDEQIDDLPMMNLDQALESMDRCGKALMKLSESKKKVQSEKIKEISYSWDGKEKPLLIFLDGFENPLFLLSPVNAHRVGELVTFVDEKLAPIDWKKPFDEIKPEVERAIKKIKSQLKLIDIVGWGRTLSVKAK